MRLPHFTEAEARPMVPRWIEVAENDMRRLVAAVAAEDWAEVHRQAVNLKWDSTNIAGVALDLARRAA